MAAFFFAFLFKNLSFRNDIKTADHNIETKAYNIETAALNFETAVHNFEKVAFQCVNILSKRLEYFVDTASTFY